MDHQGKGDRHQRIECATPGVTQPMQTKQKQNGHDGRRRYPGKIGHQWIVAKSMQGNEWDQPGQEGGYSHYGNDRKQIRDFRHRPAPDPASLSTATILRAPLPQQAVAQDRARRAIELKKRQSGKE